MVSKSWLGTPTSKKILSMHPGNISFYSFLCKWYTCTIAVIYTLQNIHRKYRFRKNELKICLLLMDYPVFSLLWKPLNYWVECGIGGQLLELPSTHLFDHPAYLQFWKVILCVQRSTCRALLVLRAMIPSP